MKYIKYIPWLIIILAVIGLAIYQYRAAEAARALLKAKNDELMKANLELGRANTKIVEQAQLHKITLADIEKKWKDEIKKREALVTMYAHLEANYQAEKKKVKIKIKYIYKDKIVYIDKDKPCDKEKWAAIKDTIWSPIEDCGAFSMLESLYWNYEDFRLHIEGDAVKKTLSYKLHQKFRGIFVETVLPTGGRNHYAKFYEVGPNGKDVGELKLEQFEVLKSSELESHMMWWNPKIDLGLGLGFNSILKFSWMADIGISISAYGSTPDDISWRFFRIGTGITGNGFSLTLSPIQFNLGKYLPLISNMWLTPTGGLEFPGPIGIFTLGISVVF